MTNEEKILELVNELQETKKKIREVRAEMLEELDSYIEWDTDKDTGQRFYIVGGNPHNQKVTELRYLLKKHQYGSPNWFKDYEEYCKQIEELRKGLW